MAKLAKSDVEFEHPAKGPHHCSECRHFLRAERACTVTQGRIMPQDWCNKFSEKRASDAREKHYAALMG